MVRLIQIKPPTEDQIKFYNLILDENVLKHTILTIESLLKKAYTYNSLKNALKKQFGYDNVEDIDHFHNNTFFNPNYRTTDKQSCDFLMIGVWVNFKKIVEGLEDILSAVQVSLGWNDVQERGWIMEVTIFISKSRAYHMKPLCTIDLKGMGIMNWKWRDKLPVPKRLHEQNCYTDKSHINDMDELKQFISFLIHVEKIPCKIHAFDRFENMVHPKNGFVLVNERKASLYTRLLEEGYVAYVKLRRKTSFDTYLMGLQRKVKQRHTK